jgi:hypothetical protein
MVAPVSILLWIEGLYGNIGWLGWRIFPDKLVGIEIIVKTTRNQGIYY